MMSMTRTFHTVGQGAFYTERHKTKNGDEFTIVYDCGSDKSSSTPEALKKKINSAFSDKEKIDILFISHFHADHINGLEFLKTKCTIKKVVLPYLDDDAKTILKVSNFLACGNDYQALIDTPSTFFGEETVIIEVRVNDGEGAIFAEGQDNPNTPPIDIDNLDVSVRPVQIESGTKITSKSIEQEWFFIPFNYKHIDRKEDFEKKLARCRPRLCLADIDTVNKIQKNKAKITAAYKAVKGDLNKNSMILFSGFDKPSHPVHCFSNTYNHHSCHHFFHRFYPFQIESGCIYFGDIDLNQKGIIDNIKARLSGFLPFVGTIQIPHHGSKENFDSDMLDNLPEIRCAVISFGTDNLYKHPSDRVISELLRKEIYPHLVTEKQDSVVIQVDF